MVSELEQNVREWDDSELSIAENIRRISNRVKASELTLGNYIRAKRKGFPSYNHYKAYIHEEKIPKENEPRKTEQRRFEEEIILLSELNCYEIQPIQTIIPEGIENIERKKDLQKLFEVLTPKEKYILEQRKIENVKIESLAKQFSVTKQRVQQIEFQALQKLRAKAIEIGMNSRDYRIY